MEIELEEEGSEEVRSIGGIQWVFILYQGRPNILQSLCVRRRVLKETASGLTRYTRYTHIVRTQI